MIGFLLLTSLGTTVCDTESAAAPGGGPVGNSEHNGPEYHNRFADQDSERAYSEGMAPETNRRGPGRPPAASREAVEQIALTLMLRDGYDTVSVDAIASAAGIGRTTFFRYFGSKPGVIWAAFDATLAWLQSGLEEHSEDDVLSAVRQAVVSSTRSALYSSDVWLERFQLLDSHPSLRSESYEHWERWRGALAGHVARAEDCDQSDPVPMAVAGACHGVFLAELRNTLNSDEDRVAVLTRLDESLALVCGALHPLLATP
jgi:AcrR family transcriptional regulator